jgi:hypothetical protein
MLRINKKAARIMPVSMATVRSTNTVSGKVVSRMALSVFAELLPVIMF